MPYRSVLVSNVVEVVNSYLDSILGRGERFWAALDCYPNHQVGHFICPLYIKYPWILTSINRIIYHLFPRKSVEI